MKIWLRHQSEALGRAIKRFGQAPLAALISILVIGVTLALPVGLYLILMNLQDIAGHVNAEAEVTLFLSIDANATDIQTLNAALKAHHAIAEFKFISKDEALQEMRAAAGLGDVLEALDKNPLPDAFVVRGKSNDPTALAALRDELAKLPKVEYARFDSAWAKNLAAFSKAGEKVILMLAAVLGVALLAVTGNTIRLQILTQREEIEVGRLIGATDSYVRRPYLYFGALQGLLGGLLALALGIAALLWLSGAMMELIEIYAPSFQPETVPVQVGAIIVGLAAFLGWLGAYASVFLYLRQLKAA